MSMSMTRLTPLARTLIRPCSPLPTRLPLRCMSTTPTPTPSPRQDGESGEALNTRRARNAAGPFTLKAGAVFLLTGSALYLYFQNEKSKIQEKRKQETATAKIGKPKIGGPFKLTDHEGREWGSENLLGRWSLVYFGFTNCPDICPEELDKMTTVVNSISKTKKKDLLPVFITCDPARDTIEAVKEYVKDFHPSLVGLTGTYEQIKSTCKAYRVYFSTPPNAKPTDDYLVDHSIFFYLMDPNGKFVDAFGRSMDANEVERKVGGYLEDWERNGGNPSWYAEV